MTTPPPGPVLPPCDSWISGSDLSGCNSDASDETKTQVAIMASMLAYELSGRQFSGICGPVTVRPCRTPCSNPVGAGWSGGFFWGFWQGDWGYDWYWGNDAGGRLCSCGYDSKVELAGYPVSEITQVKIDGSIVPTTFTDGAPQYRLDEWRFLTRLSDPAAIDLPLYWPSCQRLDLQDDQPGTWSVSYTYGVAPPPLGLEAAKQLGCQMLLAISGKPCQLPSNVSQIVRQGTTIKRITALSDILRAGGTGLFMVDSFIASYNPAGLRRRGAIFSPDMPFPVRVGAE